MNLGNGTLHVNGRQVAICTDLRIPGLDVLKKYLDVKPVVPVVSVDISCSGVITLARPPSLDELSFDFTRTFHAIIPMRHRRKVGPRRLRTVWVRPSWPSDVDSCLERGEV